LFGFLASHRLAFWRERHARLLQAGSEFREVLSNDLPLLGQEQRFSELMIRATLLQSYPRYRKAVSDFRRHLGIINRLRFDHAWKKYHGGNEDRPDFTPYSDGKDRHQNFSKRIDALLKFTK